MIKRFVFVALVAVVTFIGFGANTASAGSISSQVISAGKAQIGTPYVWGGTSTYGFDCSGFVQYAFSKAGISLPRTSSAQYGEGSYVSRSDLQPGDIVFFNTTGSGVSHDGIYIGGNQFIHSASSYGVSIASLSNTYWSPRYIGAKRVISEDKVATQSMSSDVTVELNGQTLGFDQDPVLVNGTTLVPMRAIFEELDAYVSWNSSSQLVKAQRGSTSITLGIGNKQAYVNNSIISLHEPAKLINGRTLVPLRFISESLGASVKWDHESKTAVIND